MNRALLLIDLQNDFLPGGSLAVPEGDAVVQVANEKMKSAEHIVATQDWHPVGHGSFASSHENLFVGDRFQLAGRDQVAWPDHCVEGSHGAAFASELDVDRIDHVIRKGTDPNIDSYSGFFDNDGQNPTGLDDHLKSIGITELEIMGLATDYCVLFTVLDALRLGYEVEVHLAGCRGVNLNEGDVRRAIHRMREAGATLRSAGGT